MTVSLIGIREGTEWQSTPESTLPLQAGLLGFVCAGIRTVEGTGSP